MRASSPRHAARRRAARLAAAALVLALVWAAVALLLVPPIIERAYRQESLPALNAIIAGRSLFPVAHYLTLWAAIAQRVGLALLGAAAVPFALSRQAVDERLERWLPVGPAPALPPPGRRRRVELFIAVTLVGTLGAIVSDVELWPFAPYRMYAEDLRQERIVSMLQVFGVTAAAPPTEVALLKRDYIAPFNQRILAEAFEKLNLDPQGADLLPVALEDCLQRYEKGRRAGHHDGPALSGVRLYRVTWELAPWAANLDRPLRRELLAAAALQGEGH